MLRILWKKYQVIEMASSFKEKLVRKSIKELLKGGEEPKFSEVIERFNEKIESDVDVSVSKTWVKEVAERMEKENEIILEQEKERGNLVWRIKKIENKN